MGLLKRDYQALVKRMDNHEARISAIEQSLQQPSPQQHASTSTPPTFRRQIVEDTRPSSILIDVNTPLDNTYTPDTPPTCQELNAYGERFTSIEETLSSITALVNNALGQAYNPSA